MDNIEKINRQNVLLALADNLQDSMEQLRSISKLNWENSQELRNLGEDLTRLTEGVLDISSHQIEINNYIEGLVMDINERAEKLRENARLLNEEG